MKKVMNYLRANLQRFNKKQLLIILGIIALAFFLFFANNYIQNNKFLQGEKSNISSQTFNEYLTLAGSIDSDEKVSVQFPVAGKLRSVLVFEGSAVKKNQTLATLDSRQLQKDLEKSLNTFLSSRWDLDQNKSDYKPSEAPGTLGDKWQRIIDKAQFGLNNTILDVEIRNLALESSVLKSPIEGVVTKITSPIAGVQVSPLESKIEIVNPNTLYLTSDVDQSDLKSIALGMNGMATLDAYPEDEFPVVVRNIAFAPKENEITSLYKVKIDFDRSSKFKDRRLGMTGDIKFLLAQKNIAKAVPTRFIQKEQNDYYLYIIKTNSNVEKLPVKIGEINDGFTEIFSDLPLGSVVVLPPKK